MVFVGIVKYSEGTYHYIVSFANSSLFSFFVQQLSLQICWLPLHEFLIGLAASLSISFAASVCLAFAGATLAGLLFAGLDLAEVPCRDALFGVAGCSFVAVLSAAGV
jgi:hypothetical protein